MVALSQDRAEGTFPSLENSNSVRAEEGSRKFSLQAFAGELPLGIVDSIGRSRVFASVCEAMNGALDRAIPAAEKATDELVLKIGDALLWVCGFPKDKRQD